MGGFFSSKSSTTQRKKQTLDPYAPAKAGLDQSIALATNVANDPNAFMPTQSTQTQAAG